ncbi:hypothetical protein [Hyphomicrobium sp. CS1GBMeth3]|uniref:hypothetical protein n=1 Tax=Hyphomicrobium sp. CS1GBMeth3 TaxID=1892845 RepID=UPI000931A65F|nr:hypothetical protein [Hyphomicrobium sp. CS1GBMeth3]
MDVRRIVTIGILVHVGLVGAAVYYVTRVANFTALSELPNTDFFAFSATAIPPILAALIGKVLARGARATRLLAYGLAVGAAIYAVSFAGVILARDDEPLAPLLLIVTSLWLAAGYTVLLLIVWLVGRRSP